ncbi:MAG: ABC transporter permease [Myxococcales bacterium]|nr:MAG: ABC transporter permease [Myxococcales bacterium]
MMPDGHQEGVEVELARGEAHPCNACLFRKTKQALPALRPSLAAGAAAPFSITSAKLVAVDAVSSKGDAAVLRRPGHARCGVSSVLRSARVFGGAARAQFQLTRRNIEDLRPLFGMPLVALVSVGVLVQSGRANLAAYGLVAATLMTIGQMGLFVASEIVFQERNGQTLELVVASPADIGLVLGARVTVLTAFGLVGMLESWLLVRVVFGLSLRVHHPGLLLTTLVLTSLAAAGTAMLTAALFSFGKQVRTLQNAVNGPFYLLGGVLVPTTFLPGWLQSLSPGVYFYWAANLLRAAFRPESPPAPGRGLAMIALLAIVAAALGALILRRMIHHLRREGTLGLT